MPQTDTFIMPEGWLSLEEAKHRLAKSQRTIQKLVKAKHLKCRHLPRSGRGPEPVYWAEDVKRLTADGVPRKLYEPKSAPATGTPKKDEIRRSRRSDPSGEAKLGHALELVNLVGTMSAAHKAELESRRAELSALLQHLTEFVKGEREAERERRRWEQEDARERWEAEQKRLAEERAERKQEQQRAEERARPWLTIAEAAAEYGLPAGALRQAVKEAKLIATRAGGLRIQRASLEAFAG